MPYSKKATPKKSAVKKAFKPCRGCPAPTACKRAGKCLGKK